MDRCLTSVSTPPIKPRACSPPLETFQFNVAPHPYLGSPTLNVGSVHANENAGSEPRTAPYFTDASVLSPAFGNRKAAKPGSVFRHCIDNAGFLDRRHP